MKVWEIALKDLLRSFRSFFALMFMFVVPVLVTAMFYLMFGTGIEEGAFDLPQTEVLVVNQDAGSSTAPFAISGEDAAPELAGAETMGEVLLRILDGERLAEIMLVTEVDDADAAKTAVDNQEADVALIIPENFTDAIFTPDGETAVEFYQDPTLTLGPSIVKSVVSQFMDGFSGSKIALAVAESQFAEDGLAFDQAVVQQITTQFTEYNISRGEQEQAASLLLDVRAPAETAVETNQLVAIVAPIMGGMMIFYAFFTGTASAQSIITEEEQGTLQRLYTTPTSKATILGGKFLAIGLTILIQVTVLLLFANLVFGINWGDWGLVALAVVGIVLSASTFGLFLMSLLQSSKQVGVIYGGAVTLTGMIGLIGVFTAGASAAASRIMARVSLVVPQGWAWRGLELAMDRGELTQGLLNLLVLLVWSAVFFWIGRARLRNRFV